MGRCRTPISVVPVFVLLGFHAACSGGGSSSEATGGRGGSAGGSAGGMTGGTGGSTGGAGGTAASSGSAGSPGTGGATGRGGAGGSGSGGLAKGGMAGTATAGAGGRGGGAGSAAMGGKGGGAGAVGAGGAAGGPGGAGGMTRPKVTAATGTTLVVVNPGVRHQTFEGWGTSLCWWANHVGGWSAANRNAVVDKMTDPTNGLGYNVFRYNIGGGDDPTHTHMGQYKDMPSFEPKSGTWDWNADANQRAVLQRIVADNANAVLEAFSNSPPYWMTKSGCASGSTDGSNNLNDSSYNAFADYLTEVVKHYKDTYGITFRTVEPLNEPNASWWKAQGGQEGCHFSPGNQQTILKAVAASLTTKGVTGTTVSASDENSIDDGYNNIKA